MQPSVLIDFADPRGGLHGLRCAFAAPLRTLVAHTPAQVKPVLAAVEAAAHQGQWCVGYLRFEAASAFDAALQTHPADGVLAWFGVFAQPLPWPDGRSSAGASDNARAKADADAFASDSTTIAWRHSLTRAAFDAGMARIHQAIAAGDYYQVNYTSLLDGTVKGDTAVLFARLLRAQPGGYAAYIDSGSEQVLSVSPELFFDWDGGAPGGHLLTRPMKGTAARGATAQADAANVAALQRSAKERAENVMIVDLLRNDLSRIAQPHSVQVPALFTVQSLPTVHQMISDVVGRTRAGTTLADVFAALFPCGSITGAPKVRAMQEICAIEPRARGVYCGAIGVVRPGGHATFNVAIRTVTRHGDLALCGVGSGITADATANAEWHEWRLKQRFLERASADFALLETLRLQDGEYGNLPLHLARLARAAAHFGYAFDESRLSAALRALARDSLLEYSGDTPGRSPCHANAWRVRLRLDADGRLTLEKFALNCQLAQVTIALAATPFEAFESEFTRFKTTRRGHYEAFAPTDPTLFDTLLYNPRGELTECTRGNIALLIDGQWLTPAAHCGLLEGVGRAVALRQGRLREAVLQVTDLQRAQGLAFINSLRGWLPARLPTHTEGASCTS